MVLLKKVARVGLLVAGAVISNSAQAYLIAETTNGVNVVYDYNQAVTWTSDANLLGTLEASYGASNIINAIIAANNGVILDNYTGLYQLSSLDFNASKLGMADWYGAQAFIGYLNSVDYGGSKSWQLPTNNIMSGGGVNNQLTTLFSQLGIYNYAGLTANLGPFLNMIPANEVYWLGTEYASNPSQALFFTQGNLNFANKDTADQFYSWALSPGFVAVSAVPVPGAVWLFGSSIGLLMLSYQRKIINQLA